MMARPATLDHELDERIALAAQFLVDTPLEKRLMPTVPLLRERFGLGPCDAVKAITEADRIRARAYGGADADAS